MHAIKFNDEKMFKYVITGVVLLHVIFYLGLFLGKVEYHSDEIWSYGIANNQGTPHFIWDSERNTIHVNEWLSGIVMREYLTVDNDERFDFPNAYNNCVIDLAQPLYMYMLHFISSLFPGVFSFWFLVPMQILAIIMAQLGMYGILKELRINKVLILGGMIFFALSSAGINMTIYMRPYAMMIGFSNILLWLHLKYYNDDYLNWKCLFGFAGLVFAGTLTHMFFWIYAFIMGVMFFFVFMLSKKYKKCAVYTVGMFLGAGLSIAYFPHIFSKTKEQIDLKDTYSFVAQFKLAVHYVFSNVTGIAPMPYITYSGVRIFIYICFACLIVVPFCFLFRNEKWYIKFRERVVKISKLIWYDVKKFINEYGFVLLILIVEFLANIIVVSKIVNYESMRDSVIRYLLYASTSLVIAICLLINWIINKRECTPKRCVLSLSVMVVFVTLSVIIQPPIYLGRDESEGMTLKDVRQSDVLMLTDVFWHSVCVTPYMDIDNRFCISDFDFYLEKNGRKIIPDDVGDYYVLLDTHRRWLEERFEEYSKSFFGDKEVDAATYLREKALYYKNETDKVKEYIKSVGNFSGYEFVGVGRNLNMEYELIHYIKNDSSYSQKK